MKTKNIKITQTSNIDKNSTNTYQKYVDEKNAIQDQSITSGEQRLDIIEDILEAARVVIFSPPIFTDGLQVSTPPDEIPETPSSEKSDYTSTVDLGTITFNDTTKIHEFRFNDGTEVHLVTLEGVGGGDVFRNNNDIDINVDWTNETTLTLTFITINGHSYNNDIYVDVIVELNALVRDYDQKVEALLLQAQKLAPSGDFDTSLISHPKILNHNATDPDDIVVKSDLDANIPVAENTLQTPTAFPTDESLTGLALNASDTFKEYKIEVGLINTRGSDLQNRVATNEGNIIANQNKTQNLDANGRVINEPTLEKDISTKLYTDSGDATNKSQLDAKIEIIDDGDLTPDPLILYLIRD